VDHCSGPMHLMTSNFVLDSLSRLLDHSAAPIVVQLKICPLHSMSHALGMWIRPKSIFHMRPATVLRPLYALVLSHRGIAVICTWWPWTHCPGYLMAVQCKPAGPTVCTVFDLCIQWYFLSHAYYHMTEYSFLTCDQPLFYDLCTHWYYSHCGIAVICTRWPRTHCPGYLTTMHCMCYCLYCFQPLYSMVFFHHVLTIIWQMLTFVLWKQLKYRAEQNRKRHFVKLPEPVNTYYLMHVICESCAAINTCV